MYVRGNAHFPFSFLLLFHPKVDLIMMSMWWLNPWLPSQSAGRMSSFLGQPQRGGNFRMGSFKSAYEALGSSLGCVCMKLTQSNKAKLLRTELQCELPPASPSVVHVVGGPDKCCKALGKKINSPRKAGQDLHSGLNRVHCLLKQITN